MVPFALLEQSMCVLTPTEIQSLYQFFNRLKEAVGDCDRGMTRRFGLNSVFPIFSFTKD